MGDLSYVYAVARIRVREKYLLSNTDIEQMAGMKDEKSVLAYVRDKGWGEQGSDTGAESVLAAEEEKTLALIRELKIDPSVLAVLSYPNLYHNLKAAVKEIVTSEQHPAAFYPVEKYGAEDMPRIMKDRAYDELPEHMRAAAEEAHEAMMKTGDGQLCDVIVDRACLDAMLADGKRSESRLLREYVESTVAVTDIRIAVRALRTGKNLAFLKKALAPCESLDVGELARAASESEEKLLGYLENHGFREGAEALRKSPSAFERWCDNRLIRTIKPQKANSVSMDPVIAWYLARMNEIRTVRVILTAKANGFSEDAVRERVREMYV